MVTRKGADKYNVRSMVGPEIDDGYLREPEQVNDSTVRLGIPAAIVEHHGAERVLQAIASALYQLEKQHWGIK